MTLADLIAQLYQQSRAPAPAGPERDLALELATMQRAPFDAMRAMFGAPNGLPVDDRAPPNFTVHKNRVIWDDGGITPVPR
jgi:hypothetical protein